MKKKICIEPGCNKEYTPRGNVHRCDYHHKLKHREYYKNWAKRKKEQGLAITNGTQKRMDKERIELELKGALPVPGLFSRCDKKQIEALKTGNVNLLLRT